MSGPGDLLALLRHGRALTRAQIVEESHLARATVAHRLDQLTRAGFVTAASDALVTRGRPAERLRLDPSRGCLLAVDLGSSHVRVGLADLDGTVLSTHDEDIDVDAGPDVVLPRIEQLLQELLADDSPELLGIGVGVPGPVEQSTGRLVSPPTMDGWDGIDVAARLGEHLTAPVAVDKDANIIALGVHRELRGQGDDEADDMLVVKVGMGIGAGIISRGEILRGARGAAGDLGHIPRETGPICRCGQTGCAEASSGGWALVRRLRETGRSEVRSSADLVALAHAGDAEVLALLDAAGQRIGDAVVEAVGVLNPAVVVVGGNLAEAGDVLVGRIRERVTERSHPLAARDLRIIDSPLGADAGLRGAAELAADAALSPERIDLFLGESAPFD